MWGVFGCRDIKKRKGFVKEVKVKKVKLVKKVKDLNVLKWL